MHPLSLRLVCFFGSGFFLVFYGTFIALPDLLLHTYDAGTGSVAAVPLVLQADAEEAAALSAAVEKPVWRATHVPTPEPLKALYMTSWVAGTPSMRDHLVSLAETTEINAFVVDIKDYTGNIAFEVDDPLLVSVGAAEKRIPDVKTFIEDMHRKGVYVIGRIAVFQDPFLVSKRPDLAVKRGSDGGVWKDYKGISWLDAGAKEVWEYHVALAKQAYAYGFDEINFDYIRFPSDGNMQDISYPFSSGKVKAEIMRKFFAYMREELDGTGAVLSADLFGMTATNADDLNIGQKLEYTLPYFDYVAPMVYPSHYPKGFNGHAAPATVPYEVVKFSMDRAHEKVKALAWSASTTPESREAQVRFAQIRPWLQDFDLGATYTADMVRAQMQAAYDAGLTSWMLWDASNRYTPAALLPQ